MGKIVKLREAINLIWETVNITEEQSGIIDCPYVFIIGAGISAPEILTANGIIRHCQEKVKELYQEDEEELQRIFERAEVLQSNSAKYYSYWFGQAYKNKIHRQQYLRNIINNARISTSNLLLAQILKNKRIATTVITPNFDNHLLKSLNLLGNYDVFSANNVMDNIALNKNSNIVQIMHVHGTYEFYDCCNLENEITKIAQEQGIKTTAGTIEEFFKTQSPIVLGYSGWEDDVIMSKLKERLEYAALPYSLVWFCFSRKDYEMLPDWLKEYDDVVFVLPVLKEDTQDSVGEIQEKLVLPAEDVLNALITKFGFEAPNLFSNPIQYYIDLIDGFLPENIEIFPIKSWKRRLDYIEEHLGDIEKQIILLDTAAARKDIVDITKILKIIDYSFIPTDDMQHILDGVVMPLLNSKNRIEDIKDLVEFFYVIQDLLLVRVRDICHEKLYVYLMKILGLAEYYKGKIENVDLIGIYDKVLEICNLGEDNENIILTVLGMKSEIVDKKQKIELRNEVIERGKKLIDNGEIARLILIAAFEQIKEQKSVTEYYNEVIASIKREHEKNKSILEIYYDNVIDLLDEEIEIGISMEELLDQIHKNELPPYLLLHARRVYCRIEKNIEKQVNIAAEAIEQYDIESIDSCQECIDFAFLLKYVICGKISSQDTIEQRYIDHAIKLCYKEEGCPFVSKIIVNTLDVYINSIHSQYEKRELCKKAVNICEKSKLYSEWEYFNQMYVEYLEKKEHEDYLKENERYRVCQQAREKMSAAIEAYVLHDIASCKDILLEVSECFDRIFEERYNPALVNICFMVRRGEIPELNISVLEVLNKITWMGNNAFLNINKALAYILQNDWSEARMQIRNIELDLEEALQWWGQEDVVGKKEKALVTTLLTLEDMIDTNTEMIEELKLALDSIFMPEEIKEEIEDIKSKILEG